MQIGKRPEVGVLPIDILDVSTSNEGKSHQGVAIWTSEWKKSQQLSIPAAESRSQLLSGGEIPSAEL